MVLIGKLGTAFLLLAPNNRRDAATLNSLIKNWVIPGSILYTDEWSAYNSLVTEGYTHDSVNHSFQFVNPKTGVHNTYQHAGRVVALRQAQMNVYKNI